MKKTYTLATIRKKAYAAGYRVEKGFQHYLLRGYPVRRDCNGEAYTGYDVWDLSTGQCVYESGCYDSNYDHLCTLEDVEDFLKSVYENAGLKY